MRTEKWYPLKLGHHIILLVSGQEESTKHIARLLSIYSDVLFHTGPLASFVIDRYSCRTALVLSGTLCMLGFFATAFAPNIETAIFTCGLVAGSYNFNNRTYVDVSWCKLVLFITLISSKWLPKNIMIRPSILQYE